LRAVSKYWAEKKGRRKTSRRPQNTTPSEEPSQTYKRFDAQPPHKSQGWGRLGSKTRPRAHGEPAMKTCDTWATWETELQIQRQEIVEQAGSPMIRFTASSTDRHLIRSIRPGMTVSTEGYQLDSLMQWLAEYRMHSVDFLPDVGTERPAGHPYLERVSFIRAQSSTTCVNLS
jgi:hypothetical protein